jgi:hypothetical protein
VCARTKSSPRRRTWACHQSHCSLRRRGRHETDGWSITERRVEQRLDWFHQRRRIQWLGRSIYLAVDYVEPAFKERLARYRRNLRNVRWNVWH